MVNIEKQERLKWFKHINAVENPFHFHIFFSCAVFLCEGVYYLLKYVNPPNLPDYNKYPKLFTKHIKWYVSGQNKQ